ncbi:MAG: lamin tail domain-containing protein, partial [Phycisphaerae bacterium]|nr:lamin tail domain-containing protein [Phycisphaerae bacterium]
MLEPLEPRLMLDGSVMVSEFMASNDDTILDREGNASDWIELYNPTDAPVSLNGWFLTDKTGNLDKWQIPDVTLAAAGHPGGNDYLLVFASGKNDDYPYWDGEYYHTNFTLSKEGESVLLVRSDGTTVEHGYEDYPDQITDISYGVHIGGTWNTLVDFGDSFTYLVPTPGDAGDLPDSGVSEGWTDEIFDDSNWSHDTVNGAKRLLVTEINTGDSEYVEIQNASRDLVDVNGWVVLINDPATDINAVNSTAWSLSGTMNAGEILSRNDTEWGGIDWELEGPGWAMILDDAGKVVDFVPWGYTELEIAAMSVDYGAFTGITPGDYWGGDGAAPGPGEVTSRTGNFDTDSANDFERSNNPTAGVQNAELTMPFGLIVPNQTGIGFANEQDEFETVIQTRVDHVMKEPEVGDPNASIWIRIEFDVASILGHESLTLRMKYDDGFVAYLNGAEVASANAPVTLATDSAATATQSNVQAVIYQDYDITPFMGLLHTVGTNVLAIHGLNVDAVDDDFLIQPQLVAGSSISDPRFFGIPTPGGANNPTVGAPADEVRFSRLGETFTEASFTVSLSTESPDTTIYYTRDGTVPSETSIVYTGPLTISNTTQVRARAYQPGQAPGPVNTETYIGLASDIQTHTSDIPIVIVETFGGAVGGGAKQISHISIFEPGTGGWTHITGDHALETRGGIKTRGSSTSGQSFSVESWDDHINDDDDIEPLGMPGESDWILYSSSFDKSKMNNSFIYELSNQVGQYAVRTRHVEFFLNTGGGDVSWADRKGVFVFMEKIKRGSDRVDVEALDPTDNTEPDISGGYMFKVDRLDPGDGGFNAGGQGLGWVYPKEIVIETPQYNAQENWIKNYLNQYYAALNGAGFVNPSTGLHYSDYLDVAASIDHHILNEFTKNPDEFRLSTYLYKPRDGKFAWGPIWDFDRALGFEGRSANPVGWWSDFRWGGWWSRMFNDAEFSQAWIDRYFELRANEFSHTNLQSIIDTQAATIQNSAQSYDGGWSTHRYNLKNWVTNRINWMDSQFRPMAQFSRSNGQVTPGTNVTFINLPASGNIYYTTDGTDPRAAGGGVVGQLYTGAPITINDNTKIIARVYDASATASAYCFSQVQWGASSELVVVIDTPADSSNLAITEINYNPYDPTVGELAVDSAFTSEDFEFVEITNTSTLAIALGGVKVVDGFDFEFDGDAMLPAGERAVVVANQSAFTARYGGGIPLFGEYGVGYQAPHLSNTGEGIGLVDFLGIDILNFRFNDSGSWPGRADGKGAVLEVIDPAGDYNDPSNWRSSVAYGGTPGAEAEAPLGVAINEVLSHTDLPDVDSIELYNTTGVIVDISGWYLSDSWGWASSPDNGDYKKFQIPGGTSIPVGGYLVFNEDDFNSSVGVDPLDFALDAAHGDDVWLMKTDGAGNLTHFADHVGFGAAANGESFGRWPNGVGDLYPMTLVTLEGSNSPPRVGPVIITEVMYNPPDPDGVGGVDPDDLEFIEIYNPTGSEIALSAWTDNPHGGAQYFADWRLRGGVDMEFDEGTTIAADGTLVVLSFDPNNPANATRVANFRTYYGIDASIPLTGGYGGRLDDDGERIELQRPDSPPLLEPGFAPHLTEDEVRYSDIAPWPVAPDGNGDSLHRVHSEIFGDNAGSWRSGGPTPGATSGFSMPPVVITPVDDVGVDEDSPPSVRDVSATFDDPDPGDTLTLSVSGNTNPGLVTTDLTAGILTLSYVADVNGTASIAVRATDQLGAWTEDTFTVTVASINDAPPTVIEPVVDVTVDEDSDDSIVHLSNVFDDVDFGDTLVLSLTGNTNTGLVVPSMLGNRLALSYVTDQNGTADITVRATDSGGLWVEDTFTVTVDPTNDAPAVVGPINGVIADEDDPDMIVDLANVFDDIDVGDTLSLAVSANSNTDILTANVIGTNLTLSFLPDQNGTADITIRATDSAVPGLWVEDTFTVTVNPVNDAPVMDEMPDRTLNEDTSLGSMVNLWKYVLDIEDEDRLLTFSITDNTNPDCGVSVHSDRLMDIVPAPNWYGYSDVTIEVQDLDGASDSGTFRITVNPLNDEPTVVAPIDDVFVDEDNPDTIIDLSGVFDDVDPTDTLTLLVVGNTNPSLLSAGVVVDTLTLSYIAD